MTPMKTTMKGGNKIIKPTQRVRVLVKQSKNSLKKYGNSSST